MAFFGSSQVSIEGDVNSYIQGDQNISYTTQVFQRQEREHTIYDEFPYIQRGLIYRVRDLHRQDCFMRWNRESHKHEIEFRAERVISTAEILGDSSRYTVISYKGQDAEKVWEKEFRQWSDASDATKMQLFGINRSSIPFLLFHRELVPFAHFEDRIGLFGRHYAYTLAWRIMNCAQTVLWMDPKGGTLVRGVQGPDSVHLDYYSTFDVKTLPPSAELLQEDICWRFFSHLPLDKAFDRSVVHALQRRHKVFELPFSSHLPSVFSHLNKLMIGIGIAACKTYPNHGCLDSPVLMPDGRTKFSLIHNGRSSFEVLCGDHSSTWMSQASSVFHNCGISLNEDLSKYELFTPWVLLEGSIDNLEVAQQRHLKVPPIYLFLHPTHFSPPLKKGSLVSAHTWSFDKDGKTSISCLRCEYLGLPLKLLVLTGSTHKYIWSSETYQIIHKWQVARGFDPTTTDFAHHCEYPLYEVVQPKFSQFEELNEGESPCSSLTHFAEVSDKEGQGQSTLSSIWSILTAPLTSVACEKSEIPMALM
ncbi:hypothetical protein L218DRAFT_922406 [Marasmius fiardii PR-910]|nr:hypothetical protein L218DRAFT_922406 [Marasmius fiardii PR-910]